MATPQLKTDLPEVDLFLLGKTGHGKSSTGNTILGKYDFFEVCDDSESVTCHVQVGWSHRMGHIIKVVDGPGIWETRLTRGDAVKKMSQDFGQGVMLCPNGFHALLLVLKYGGRYTEEEARAVNMLKEMFGDNFIRDYCIVVFTYGDNFDTQNKRNPGRTFSDWCNSQRGSLQTLLKECDYRVVLFYNENPEKGEEQTRTLLALVENMKRKGARYTHKIFEMAALQREQLIVRENAPELREKIQAKINLLAYSIEEIKDSDTLSPNVEEILKNIKKDAIDLQTEIDFQDKGTMVLDSLRQVAANILLSIKSHKKALRQKQAKDELEGALKSQQRKHEMTEALMIEQQKRDQTEVINLRHTVERQEEELRQREAEAEENLKKVREEYERENAELTEIIEKGKKKKWYHSVADFFGNLFRKILLF